LIPEILPYSHPPADGYEGNGLFSSVPDYMHQMCISHDIISPTPKPLKPSTVSLRFEPQFSPGSGSPAHLYMHQSLFENSAGGHIGNLNINYGLKVLLMIENTKSIGAKGTLPLWHGRTA
jgi:hypothetical protein